MKSDMSAKGGSAFGGKSDVIVKLEEHDKKFGSLTKKLEEHDRQFGQIGRKLEDHDKKFDQIDQRLDLIVGKVLEHDVRLERIEEAVNTKVATKDDINNIINTIDKFVGLHTKHDQEIVFLGQRVKRVENILGV